MPSIDIFNDNGTLSEAAGLYVGMDRFDVRKQIEEDLRNAGLLVKDRVYENKVVIRGLCNGHLDLKFLMHGFLKMELPPGTPLVPVINYGKKFDPPKLRSTCRHWM